MRGISSIFGSKPSDKPLNSRNPSTSRSQSAVRSKTHSRLFSTISGKNTTDMQHSSFVNPNDCPAQAPSSSRSSSTISHSLPTPDDDKTIMRTTSTKLHWKSWLGGGKKSNGPAAKKSTVTSQHWAVPRQTWRSRPPPVLQPPPPHRHVSVDDSEDETSSESESEDESDAGRSSGLVMTRNSTYVAPLASDNALTILRIITEYCLQPPFSPPPLLFAPGQPAFPRSCNSRRALYKQETLESRMHRTRLLRIIDNPKLARAHDLSFGKRTAALIKKRPSLHLNEEAVPNTFQSCNFSQGLRKWVLRPCFEDRMDVWVPGDDILLRTRVTGPSLGVAALEISEYINALASANCDGVDLEPPSNFSGNPMSNITPALQGPNAPSLPSPLRIEHSPSPLPLLAGDPLPEPHSMPAIVNAKRGVRFAEDDKEDQIPLGYVLRIRKRREEKAKFLQEEKERRAFEQERARQDEERAQREAERREWEMERLAWEKERRAAEEERKQRLYADEVAAARLRRDAARSGVYIHSGMETTRPQSREFKSSRKFGHDLPPISTQRQTSDPVVLATGSASPYTASPVSSGPPSNGGSPATSALFSRPSSMHSVNTTLSSAEDMLQNRKMESPRSSFASDSSQRPDRHSKSYYPVLLNTYPVPPLPSIPLYNLDMPLLPPTPPFMMHQTRRSQSPNSSSNRSSSPRHKPNILTQNNNNSSDRVSTSSLRNGSLKHHRRGSSDDALKGIQKPGLDRRSGSAADIGNPRSSGNIPPARRSQQQLRPSPPMSQPPSTWATSSLPRNSRDRPPMNWRQNVIT